ncbi:RNA-binding protein Lupus La [Tanacetum coccineum]
MAANTISPVRVSPENNDCGGGTDGKKPVWSKPGVASSPVMGAVSWPALGESPSKGLMKTESLEAVDGVGVGDGPALQEVSGNSSPSSHKQMNANNIAPAKHKSMKRGGGSFKSNVSVNGGASHTSSTNQDLVVDNPQHSSGKPGTGGSESSPRDNTQQSRKGGHNGNDHQHQRSYRRSNSGQHSRGDGSNHYSNGGKRDQDRGNNEWNQHSRSFNGRDTNVNPQRGYARGYVRPTVHAPAPFISQPMPLPVRPFGNNMIYPELPSPVFYVQGPPPPPEALRAMPMVGPVPPPMYFASPDHLLHARIGSQIDYYFSNENLVRDTYLRKNMDEQGWVPVSLIAGFKKALNLNLIRTSESEYSIEKSESDSHLNLNKWSRTSEMSLSTVAGRMMIEYHNNFLTKDQLIWIDVSFPASKAPPSELTLATSALNFNGLRARLSYTYRLLVLCIISIYSGGGGGGVKDGSVCLGRGASWAVDHRLDSNRPRPMRIGLFYIPILKLYEVKNLTDNVQQILDAMRASTTIVNFKGDQKIGERNDWDRWLMQPHGHL